jgi:hypothetical protein
MFLDEGGRRAKAGADRVAKDRNLDHCQSGDPLDRRAGTVSVRSSKGVGEDTDDGIALFERPAKPVERLSLPAQMVIGKGRRTSTVVFVRLALARLRSRRPTYTFCDTPTPHTFCRLAPVFPESPRTSAIQIPG